MAPCSLVAPSPSTWVRFSRSSPAVMPNLRMKSLAADSRSPYSSPPFSSSGRPKYAFDEMAVAPSKPCRRVLASACAVGSKEPLLKNSSDEIPFWLPNLLRAKVSPSSSARGAPVSPSECL